MSAKLWYELAPEMGDNGKYKFQEALIKLVVAMPPKKTEKGDNQIQEICILGPDGSTPVAMSVFMPSDSTDLEFGAGDIGKEVTVWIKMQPDTSQYAYQGHKYLIMRSRPGGKGGGFRGKGGWKQDPKESYEIRLMAMAKNVTALIVAGKIEMPADKAAFWAQFGLHLVDQDNIIDSMVKIKFPGGAAPADKPKDDVPI